MKLYSDKACIWEFKYYIHSDFGPSFSKASASSYEPYKTTGSQIQDQLSKLCESTFKFLETRMRLHMSTHRFPI
jgi:hypothetical protein